tara:strand:- start:360 stop:527 length:168 start_codon:yes stop_codon:yes gene_type:complete
MGTFDDAWRNASKPDCFYCGKKAEIHEDGRNYCGRCYREFVMEPDEKNNYGKDKI